MFHKCSATYTTVSFPWQNNGHCRKSQSPKPSGTPFLTVPRRWASPPFWHLAGRRFLAKQHLSTEKVMIHCCLLSLFLRFICEKERQLAVKGAKREGERVSQTHGTWHGAQFHDLEIMAWAEIKSWMLNQPSHPAPFSLLFNWYFYWDS